MGHGLDQYGPARKDATAQLLLLIARDVLSDQQIAKMHALSEQVTEWHEFVSLCLRNAGLPFAYKHMSAILREKLEPAVFSELKARALRQTMDAMKLSAAMSQFHKDCLEPISADYFFMKGPALGVQYYRDAALRTSCDVDVLVSQSDFSKVARLALEKGYRFLFQTEEGDFATKSQDLDFLIRHAECISAFNPDGIHFEIHRHIEKTTPIFPTGEILSASQAVKFGRATIRTMPIAWHFVYITYHHSRHFWSRLHWIADLHALMSHQTFDRNAVLALARRIGLLPTVQAAMEFADLTDKANIWPDALGVTPAGIFLDAALRGLPGDHAFELESWDAMFLFDFGDEWQFDKRKKYLFWAQSAWRRLQPNEHQYQQQPRKRSLEWLYTLENIRTLGGNLLKRIGFQS